METDTTELLEDEKRLQPLEDLGWNLHAALRKCCDSDPTSLVYNLICMDAFSATWLNYLEAVLAQDQPVTVEKLKNAAKSLAWGTAESNALRIAFRAFSDDDWAGFIYFAEREER